MMRPACWSISMDHTSSTPIEGRVRLIFLNSPSGGTTNTACWHRWMGSWCRSPSISIRSTFSTASILKVEELEAYLESIAEKRPSIRTSEDVIVSRVGRDLYEKMFRGYTRKQWGLDPSELDASVAARIPVRLNRDDRYFSDTYQAMPLHGFTRMFENMLDHPNITNRTEHGLSRRSEIGPLPRAGLYRPGGRILRLPFWQAALPVSAVPARDAGRANDSSRWPSSITPMNMTTPASRSSNT